jgi:hypothetical protein
LSFVIGKITGYILLLSSVGAVNPLNAELNHICHQLALLGAHHILHVGRIRVKMQSQLNMPEWLGWGFLLYKILIPWVLLMNMW